MAFILLDESGDLGFKLNKGSSKFFIVTVIFANSKRPLEKIARAVHDGLRKKFKKVGVLHAYNETTITRTRVLRMVAETECAILAIILDKKKVYTKLQNEKAVLYNYVTNILLDRLFRTKPVSIEKPLLLIASRKETNKFLNENFKRYLSQQVSETHKLNLAIEIATPQKEKSLQIVDFVSWAIFRKYEKGDDVYYNLISTKIIGEAPLFA